MRIVSGKAGGLRIASPPGSARPTTDRVREAIFSSLGDQVEGARILDLFAGSGAMGMEALSRGAALAVFVERDSRAAATIRSNLASTRLADSGEVACAEVLAWLARETRVGIGQDAQAGESGAAGRPFGIAFADPPYLFDQWEELLALIEAEVLVAESDREIVGAVGWESIRARRYGGTVVTVMRRTKVR